MTASRNLRGAARCLILLLLILPLTQGCGGSQPAPSAAMATRAAVIKPTPAELIATARALTDNGQTGEARAVVAWLLAMEPRNEYGLEVLPLLGEPNVAPQQKYEPPEEPGFVHQLDRKLPEVKLDNVTLEETINFFSEVGHRNVAVHWAALKSIGVRRDSPVNIRLHNVKWEQGLEMVLDSVSTPKDAVGYELRNIVVIAPKAQLPTLEGVYQVLPPPAAEQNPDGRAK